MVDGTPVRCEEGEGLSPVRPAHVHVPPRARSSSDAMVRASTTSASKPLELGAKLLCKGRDQILKSCEVIERKQNEDTAEWRAGTVDRWAVDGRTLISFDDAGVSQWLDLTKCRYRWVVNTPRLADGATGTVGDDPAGEP